MRWNRFYVRPQFARMALFAALLGAALGTGRTAAQAPPGDQLPRPRLLVVTPNGGKVGTSFELSFSGSDLDEPQALLFSHPSLKAEPIIPPAPPAPKVDPKKPAPKADPKKPAPPPPPPPPVTKFKITIPADAPLGIHDVRLVSKYGVSNPRAFVVGDLAEVAEKEPNNDIDQAQRVDLNTTVHGAIAAPTDVDYFVFTGKKGQRVVVSCLASSIDSRLHAALELYDSSNRQLADNLHHHGDDALVDLTVPHDGDYFVRLYEFSHTEGSPEHFYRLSVTTAPWIDAVFPPVVEPGKEAKLTVYGRNLPDGKLDPTAKIGGRVLEKITVSVNVPHEPAALQRLTYSGLVPAPTSGLDGFEYRIRSAVGTSNPFLLMYATAPVVLDNEANDTPETAQEITLPCEIAGRVEKRRDRDWYTFSAKKGEVYSIELLSERLGAPTDMYFALRNPATKQDLGEFDDDPSPLLAAKFMTNSQDPVRHRFVVPADGKYQLLVASRLADSQAGPNHLYRARITPERPDFRLVILPADNERPDSCVLLQGSHQSLDVLVRRQDGWNDSITLTAEGLPAGVTCLPQVLGPGMTRTSLVLTAAADAPVSTSEIRIQGVATIHGHAVFREARPASLTWPVTPGQNIPLVSRLDRNLLLAVREKAPFNLSASLDKATVFQGDKATLALRLARLWPDFKTPLQVAVTPAELPANLTVNNNQPLAMAPGKDDGGMVIDVKPNVQPGTYNLLVRGTAQIPYNKDPKAAQKPPTNVVLPANAVSLTVLPKQVATLSASLANPAVKIGGQAEVLVKVARMHDFTGEFTVKVVLPPNAKGVSTDEVTIPAGKDEAKVVLKVAGDAVPVNLTNLTVHATALLSGNLPLVHEAKFNVNVVK